MVRMEENKFKLYRTNSDYTHFRVPPNHMVALCSAKELPELA